MEKDYMLTEDEQLLIDEIIAARSAKREEQKQEMSILDLKYEDMSADLSEELDSILPEEEFDLRELRIISLRLGLDDLPRSPRDIVLEFNISEDYVHTIDAKLMKYICESKLFKEFVLRLDAPDKHLSEDQIIQIEHLIRFEQQVVDRISDEESEDINKES